VRYAAFSGVSKSALNCTVSTWPNAKPNPMNEPNVPMYSSDMTHVCGSLLTSRMACLAFFAAARLSILKAAMEAAMRTSGM
jgi:hypothetical protein